MRYVPRIYAIVALAALTSCSAGGQLSMMGQPVERAGMIHQTAAAGSWIDPAAKTSALLYVTGGSDVHVFTWPKLRRAGLLRGFQQTTGACVDAAGNVWIADPVAQKLYEYGHGGTTAIAMLDDEASLPNGCAVNKRDGDLAVGNEYNNHVGEGSITIYRHASGPGSIYYDSALDDVDSLDYGPKGNLFLDGWTGSAFGMASFAGTMFTTITIKGATIGNPGGVQYWDDTLTVGDAGSTVRHPTIYRITDAGRVLGKTVLGQAYQSLQYQIRDGKLICACYEDRDIQIYPYPAGQTPTKTVSIKGRAPWAAVVSPPVTGLP